MYSSYSESFQIDYRIPQCYTLSKNKQDGVKEDMVRNVLPDRVLMYIFYNMPNDRYQLVAAETLTSRGWTYVAEEMRWVRMKTYQG
jgi:CCR4-NOT transcriptional regulation complex NOT5 subunit